MTLFFIWKKNQMQIDDSDIENYIKMLERAVERCESNDWVKVPDNLTLEKLVDWLTND